MAEELKPHLDAFTAWERMSTEYSQLLRAAYKEFHHGNAYYKGKGRQFWVWLRDTYPSAFACHFERAEGGRQDLDYDAAVPLYKIFCQATGFGGETQRASVEKFEKMTPSTSGRLLRITFNADTSDTMPWSFKPSQRSVEVHPGETALAFFRAKNNTDEPVTGVATYNVTPMRAGVYFNKIQCFCFEEQV